MKTKLAFVTISFYAIMFICSCGTPSNNNQVTNEHEHHHEENETNHNQEHMQHMTQTREWLQKELGEKYNEPVTPATTEQLNLGKEIFTANCASCHGINGEGDGQAAAALNPKPANFTDTVHSTFYSEQARIYIIKKGITATAMVGWENSLKEIEILAVYAYINSLKKNAQSKHSDEHHEHNHSN